MSTKSKAEPKRNVIAIKRVSTPGQVGDDKYGMARQEHGIEQAVTANNLSVLYTVEIVESGSTAFNRDDFKKVFADLALPHIAGVVVSSVDRLVRPGFLGDLAVFDPFQRHGKLIFTPSQVIDVATDGGYLMAGMFGMSAGLEKRLFRDRTLGAKERARAAGRHPQGPQMLPRGLEFVRERDERGNVVKSYWRYTAEAQNVKRCYDLLFRGASFDAMAKDVGFKTGRGVAWILRNTCWKGIRTYPPNSLRAVPLEKPMGIEPLISPGLWAKAQDILDAKRTATRARRRQEYEIALGLNLLRCRCGRFLYLRREYRPGRSSYYFCASGHRGEGCGAPSIRRTVADAKFLDAVAAMSNVATVREMVAQALKPAAKPQPAIKTQREIQRVTGERERLIDMRIKNKITESQFDQRDAKLASELRGLEALLPRVEPVIDPKIMASAIAGLFAEFPYLTVEEQHALAHRTFVAFDVNEDGAVDTAVIRGQTLSQLCATNGRHSSATK